MTEKNIFVPSSATTKKKRELSPAAQKWLAERKAEFEKQQGLVDQVVRTTSESPAARFTAVDNVVMLAAVLCATVGLAYR